MSQLIRQATKKLAIALGLFSMLFTLFLQTTPALAVEGDNSPDTSSFTIGGIIKDGDVVLEGVQIQVVGDGFDTIGTTAADGRWSITVPGKGEYTVTLQLETLPEGASLRDPNKVT